MFNISKIFLLIENFCVSLLAYFIRLIMAAPEEFRCIFRLFLFIEKRANNSIEGFSNVFTLL